MVLHKFRVSALLLREHSPSGCVQLADLLVLWHLNCDLRILIRLVLTHLLGGCFRSVRDFFDIYFRAINLAPVDLRVSQGFRPRNILALIPLSFLGHHVAAAAGWYPANCRYLYRSVTTRYKYQLSIFSKDRSLSICVLEAELFLIRIHRLMTSCVF